MTERPLILLTNDDGLHSPGLRTLAQALAEIGDVLVAAPWEQQSSTGRSMDHTSSRIIHTEEFVLNGERCKVYGIEGTPGQAVQHGMLELTPRKPDLIVSGINFGENMGMSVTISGTVMAAYEGAAWGVPAMAISSQMGKEEQVSLSDETDVTVAAYFAQKFARILLNHELPEDVHLLKVDVPRNATRQTGWRLTRLSRQSYYIAHKPPRRDYSQPFQLDWDMTYDRESLEPDSDIYTLRVAEQVSVTPLSLDFSSRLDLASFERALKHESD